MEETKNVCDLRKDDYLMIQDHPCKIFHPTFSKTPKNGVRKVHFIGLDIVTGQKYETLVKSNDKVTVVIIDDYQIYNILPNEVLLKSKILTIKNS